MMPPFWMIKKHMWFTDVRNKYSNKKTEVDGVMFDSRKEAKRYGELKLLQKAKEIKFLELQPEFILVPKFVDAMGEKHREVIYRADFSYFDIKRKKHVIEDSKGMQTEVYKIKKKLFLSLYRDYLFIES